MDEQLVPEKKVETVAPAVRDAFIGSVLADHYEILERVGSGGYSHVYKAVQHPLGRIVAVKILQRHMLADPEAAQRFKQEAKAATQLIHQNIAPVFDYGLLSEGQPYLVMEYLEGFSLTQWIRQSKQLSPREAADVLLQLCAGLQMAHSRGVIHRDLKPDNVVVVNRGTERIVKIVDFGLAKLMPESGNAGSVITQLGTTLGTPAYMSPEQCRGLALDGRADIYSLGCILFEALTGRIAFQGQNLYDTIHMQIAEEVKFTAEETERIPAQLQYIVKKAVAKAREDRFQSVQDLAAKLQQYLDNDSAGGDVLARTQLALQNGVLLLRSLARRHTTTSILIFVLVSMGLWQMSEHFRRINASNSTNTGRNDLAVGIDKGGSKSTHLQSGNKPISPDSFILVYVGNGGAQPTSLINYFGTVQYGTYVRQLINPVDAKGHGVDPVNPHANEDQEHPSVESEVMYVNSDRAAAHDVYQATLTWSQDPQNINSAEVRSHEAVADVFGKRNKGPAPSTGLPPDKEFAVFLDARLHLMNPAATPADVTRLLRWSPPEQNAFYLVYYDHARHLKEWEVPQIPSAGGSGPGRPDYSNAPVPVNGMFADGCLTEFYNAKYSAGYQAGSGASGCVAAVSVNCRTYSAQMLNALHILEGLNRRAVRLKQGSEYKSAI